jgi:hypothetical protein
MATVEYAARALLVAAAVAGAGGAAVGGEGGRVADAVGSGVRRALCTVAGGGCDERGRSRPCAVSTLARRRDAHVDLAFVRLSDGRRVLRERLSDGSVRLTVVQSGGGGGVVGFGGRFGLAGVDVRAEGQASAQVGAGYGRVFEAPDEAAADRLLARLNREDWKAGGALRGLVRFAGGGGDEGERERFLALRSDGDARAALSALGFDAGAGSAVLERAVALRLDRRTGERTLVLEKGLEGGLELDAQVAQVAQVAGGVAMQRTLELVLDRANRPTAFVLRAAGGARGGARGERAELEAHLDLTDQAARRLAGRLLHGEAGALPDLVGRLWERGRLETRRYRVTQGEATSSGVSAALLAKAGVEIARSSSTARLVAASGRDPGMGWTRRLDCELAAGAPLAA